MCPLFANPVTYLFESIDVQCSIYTTNSRNRLINVSSRHTIVCRAAQEAVMPPFVLICNTTGCQKMYSGMQVKLFEGN